MGGKRTKATKEAKAKAQPSLKNSFAATRNRVTQKSPARQGSGPLESGEVSRAERSGFLSYLRSCSHSQDESKVSHAAQILEEYRGLDPKAKSLMVSMFFRQGGKKAGLEMLFDQKFKHSESATELGWAGYISTKGLMKLFEVHCMNQKKHEVLPTHPKHHNIISAPSM